MFTTRNIGMTAPDGTPNNKGKAMSEEDLAAEVERVCTAVAALRDELAAQHSTVTKYHID
jgi:hypothetical protein